ncbi:MAG: EboA domain-containing protein [Verrucomicrobiota bacterium]
MRETLIQILGQNAAPEAMTWLQDILEARETSFQKRPFYYAFSGVSRQFGKKDFVNPGDDQLADLNREIEGFTVKGWDHFRMARVILLTTLADQEEEVFLTTLVALLNTADLREQVAIFSAFPLFPHPEKLVESAADGLRTNIVEVFDSIALHNAFPSKHFGEEAWNQMILKAIFIARPLHRILGFEERRNPALAEAIADLAHERWAAGREITPEAWRGYEGLLADSQIPDIEQMAQSANAVDRQAAALVVASDSGQLLSSLTDPLAPELEAISNGNLTWHTLGQTLEDLITRKSLT